MELAHEEQIRKRDADFAREKRTLKEQHKLDLENLLAEQIRELSDLKEQFARARQLHEDHVLAVQAKVDEVQALY